jgi:zinc transporter ZupT
MNRTTLITIGYGLAAAVANLMGGLFVTSRKLGQSALRYLIALGAGFMLAAVFLKIVPETIEQWQGSPVVPMAWVLAATFSSNSSNTPLHRIFTSEKKHTKKQCSRNTLRWLA